MHSTHPSPNYFPSPTVMDWTRRHVIGRGSSATVFLASAPLHGGALFAVKSAEISRSQSLRREQQFLSALASPFVVSYRGYEVRTEPSGVSMFNLFLEYLPYGSLADEILRRGGRLDEGTMRDYTRQLLRGLQYIHSKHLVHCDIKPQNILIGGDGVAKLADFGCAKWATQIGPIGGTPLFMAPEVARGEHQGLAADIWSIGCTFVEMATGSPWPKRTDSDPISAVYRIGYSGESPEIPSFLSRKAKDFLEKCLKRNPNERWTVDQLLNHPFLDELNSNFSQKQVQEVNDSESPTSILEQRIWRSIDEESEITESRLLRPNGWAAEQIGRLAFDSGEPRWIEDEDWMTIRREENGKSESLVKDCWNDEWGEKQRISSGGKEWLEMECIHNKNVSCRISWNHLAHHSCSNIISLLHNYNVNYPLSFHTYKPEFVSLMPSLLL